MTTVDSDAFRFCFQCLSLFSSLLCSVSAQPQSVPVQYVICDATGEKPAVFLHRLCLTAQEKQSEDVQEHSSLISPSPKHSFQAMISILSKVEFVLAFALSSLFPHYFTKLLSDYNDVYFIYVSIYIIFLLQS